MKKIILTLCFALCSIALFGQFNVGIKAGLNLSSLKVGGSNSLISYEVGPGFDAGVFLRIGKKLYVQPEVLYSLKTTTPDFEDIQDEIFENDEDNQKFQTLDIPILVGYKIYDGDDIKFRGFLGPRFGFALRNSLGANIDGVWADVKSGTFDFAGQVGVGVDLWRFTVDLMYDYTFTNGYRATIDEVEMKTHFSTFKFCVGFKILK